MSSNLSSTVRIECTCSTPRPWVDLRFAVLPSGDVNIYGLMGEGIGGGEYFVDRNRRVTLPDPNNMPAEGFTFVSAHLRWRLQCQRCDRHPVVATATNLKAVIKVLAQHNLTHMTLDALESRVDRGRK